MAEDIPPHRAVARAAYAAVAGGAPDPGGDTERAVDAAADAVHAALLAASAPAPAATAAEIGAVAHVPSVVLRCARALGSAGTAAAVVDGGEIELYGDPASGFELWSAVDAESAVGHRLTPADAATLAAALAPALADDAPLPERVRADARAAAVEQHILSTHLAGLSVDPSRISDRTRRVVQRQTQECVDAAAEVVWRAALAARRVEHGK